MDCHKLLLLLTDFDKYSKENISDDHLKKIIVSVQAFIPQNSLKEILDDRTAISTADDAEWQYLHLLLYTIKMLCNNELSEENPLFTVAQFRVIKKTIEVAACHGIVPFLVPALKSHANRISLHNFKLKTEYIHVLEKNKRLCYTMCILLDCFNNLMLRPALISQLNHVLAALLQLSHAPLKKPNAHDSNSNCSNSELEMTNEIYTELKKQQESFGTKFNHLIENCPQSTVIKELMVLLAIKNNPKWIQVAIRNYLTERIMIANGIISLTLAICNEVSDFGKCWDKLDVTAKLVATSHGSDPEKYYNSICLQIFQMLTLKNNSRGTIIGNSCIKALYDYNPDLCITNIFDVIIEPLISKSNVAKNNSCIHGTEDKVSECIESLCKLFITTDAEFKCLPIKLLRRVSMPIFYLNVKSYKSIYRLRNQVRELLLKILKEEPSKEDIFSVFLNHQIKVDEFGEKLYCRFGVNGELETTSEISSIDSEELADCLFDIVEKDKDLAFDLFTYLLKILPELSETTQKFNKNMLLETTTDTMEIIEKRLIALKLLTLLSSSILVQQALTKNPKSLLNFIKFFFTKTCTYSGKDIYSEAYEQDIGILYTGLMLIKIIISDGKVTQSWETYENFIYSIKQQFNTREIPEHISSIVKEIELLVKKRGKMHTKIYYDLSADNKKLSDFDKAVTDLADPLLPVRAHGIITLTKLIECRDPEATLKKDFLLCIFQENLSHDDSFIYLAAINGICAMSTMFSDKVIEILVQEFVRMTSQSENRDIGPETRAKIGEILVKTTRSLGEMTPKYKSLLVNGFLSGVKDCDALVRASSLSCLGEFCKIMGFRLGNLIIEILYCIECIIKTDKDDGCRRAGVLVTTLLLRGLGKHALTELAENLVPLYRTLKHLRDNDKDSVLRLHAQLALEEFDDIVKQLLFAKPRIEKSIFLLSN